MSKPNTVSSRKGTCICVFNLTLLSNTFLSVPGVSSVLNSWLWLLKCFSHVHKSSVRCHQWEPSWWRWGLSQGGATLKNQSRARTVSFLSVNQYIAFCGVRVKPIPWDDLCAVSPAVGAAAAHPGQLHPQRSSSVAEGLLVTSCSGSVLCLEMWSCWHELMALGGVKISFSYLGNQGGRWLWVSFWKCSVPEQKPARGAGSRHFPACDPLHCLQRVIPLLFV